ncbi:hypothetical protein AB0L97_20195 [Nocardia sp. NPDC051911]|uniref:hypothetical protein n=1 Tax=Nocardia sp. NPDC051911 TaxID=3154648 RepID=UPI0034350FE3
MSSPATQELIDQWARGFTPTGWAQRHFRSTYRLELEAALARLILLLEGDEDELRILPSVQSFAEYVGRLDAQLRRDLAGDRHPGRDAGIKTHPGGKAA